MKNKQSFIWLTLGFLALIATVWIGKPEPREPLASERASAPLNAKPAMKPQEKAAKAAVVSAAGSKFSNAPANEEELKRLIPFKVKDKLAIAYGDVILGEVEPGTEIEDGYYRPDPIRLWDETEIPYAIAPELTNPRRVEDAIRYLQKNTRLVFVPYTGQDDAILFEPGTEHCLSFLGKTGGHQPIRLANDCGRTEILHEIMHALGFIHEHSRPDRDEFVEVVWENVDDKFREQFAIAPSSLNDPSRGSRFDFKSIMLYPSNLFGKKPGLVTLRGRGGVPLDPVENALSEGDLQRIRDTYR